jgi:hypothetical protein
LKPFTARELRLGRLYHVAWESDGQIQVFDVWDSQESFDAFGETLAPIMAELGTDPRAAAGFDGAQHHSGLTTNAEELRGSRATRRVFG